MATIRPYEPRDRDAIRTIAADTGFFGRPTETVIHDRDFMATALTSYYLDFEPEAVFVAEEDGKVLGYACGCTDCCRHKRLFMRHIAPKLLVQFFMKGLWRSSAVWDIAVTLLRALKNAPAGRKDIEADYPAHCHINLAPHIRGKGVGRALMERLFAFFRERGVKGVHASVATEGGKAFFTKMGFRILDKRPTPPFKIPHPAEGWIMGILAADFPK